MSQVELVGAADLPAISAAMREHNAHSHAATSERWRQVFSSLFASMPACAQTDACRAVHHWVLEIWAALAGEVAI